MAVGTVKWFNNRKGYGFIQPQEGGNDIFVHITALQRASLKTLFENQRIEYQLTESRGKTVATELKLLDKEEPGQRASAGEITEEETETAAASAA